MIIAPPRPLTGEPCSAHPSFRRGKIVQFALNDSFVIANFGNYTIASPARSTFTLCMEKKKMDESGAVLYPSIRHYL